MTTLATARPTRTLPWNGYVCTRCGIERTGRRPAPRGGRLCPDCELVESDKPTVLPDDGDAAERAREAERELILAWRERLTDDETRRYHSAWARGVRLPEALHGEREYQRRRGPRRRKAAALGRHRSGHDGPSRQKAAWREPEIGEAS